MQTFSGSPFKVGFSYGRQFSKEIACNINSLVGSCTPYKDDIGFKSWITRQEQWLMDNASWLIEEIKGAGQGSGQPYDAMLLLNLRAWQYNSYGKPSESDLCSSFVMPLSDGTIAAGGAIDDSAEYYCGAVHMAFQNGYGFITFPIAGTCWASRAHNNEGLSIGISSQHLPGIRKSPDSINQDIAVRIIIQTCSTADEVRRFCKKHRFILNIACVDAKGEIFAAHNTTTGLFEVQLKDNCCVLTNHISDDSIMYELSKNGLSDIPESKTTRIRRGRLLGFIKSRQSKCDGREITAYLAKTDKKKSGSVRNEQTIYLTYSNPQKYPKSFWILDCHQGESAKWLETKV